ncbi:MAG: hypothetical protein AAFY26_08880 [Cyanobacteria bacterium J06638_22]
MAKAKASIASTKTPRSNAQPKQQTDSETDSRHILGPVSFALSELRIEGTADDISMPFPGQASSIVAEDEHFLASLTIQFNKSPLSALLMCLGTQITVNFHFEGQSRQASEFDGVATIVTQKDEFTYEVELEGLPSDLDMHPGLYEVSATVEVGPAEHECSQLVLGYGYCSNRLLQVHSAV